MPRRLQLLGGFHNTLTTTNHRYFSRMSQIMQTLLAHMRHMDIQTVSLPHILVRKPRRECTLTILCPVSLIYRYLTFGPDTS